MAGPPKKRQRREDIQDGEMPQKKYYRQRAHANPFSDHDLTYPASPAQMDWSQHYPAFVDRRGVGEAEETTTTTTTTNPKRLTKNVTIADIGCGFGGLLFALSTKMPDRLILGLEIRSHVTSYVVDKIRASRSQNLLLSSSDRDGEDEEEDNKDDGRTSGPYQNISCLRANTMKFLPNLFPKASLTHIFLCFPDPHFKARKHKARIVSAALCGEYAYALAPGVGKVYTITDVRDLHEWMLEHFTAHPSFERVDDAAELESDACVALMTAETEEGKKVERNGGGKHVAVFRRSADPDWPAS